MSLFTLTEAPPAPERQLFPDGTVLDAEVAKVEVKTVPWTDDEGNPIQKVNFTFEVPGHITTLSDGREFPLRVYGETSTVFSSSENCRLRAWVQEIMSVDELPVGFSLDLDDLAGNPCRVILEWREYDDKKAPVLPDGSFRKKQINRVRDVLRAGTGASGEVSAPSGGLQAPVPPAWEESEPF